MPIRVGDGPRGVRVFARDVDRPELRLDASLAEPRDVGLAGLEPAADVEPGERDVALGAEPPGEVVVPVEEQPRAMDQPRPFRNGRRLFAPDPGRGRGRHGDHNGGHPHQPATGSMHGGLLELRQKIHAIWPPGPFWITLHDLPPAAVGRSLATPSQEVCRAVPSSQEEDPPGEVPQVQAVRRPGAPPHGPVQEMLRGPEVGTGRVTPHSTARRHATPVNRPDAVRRRCRPPRPG
jgi:hypothetical protein